jgi:hypothetical protein
VEVEYPPEVPEGVNEEYYDYLQKCREISNNIQKLLKSDKTLVETISDYNTQIRETLSNTTKYKSVLEKEDFRIEPDVEKYYKEEYVDSDKSFDSYNPLKLDVPSGSPQFDSSRPEWYDPNILTPESYNSNPPTYAPNRFASPQSPEGPPPGHPSYVPYTQKYDPNRFASSPQSPEGPPPGHPSYVPYTQKYDPNRFASPQSPEGPPPGHPSYVPYTQKYAPDGLPPNYKLVTSSTSPDSTSSAKTPTGSPPTSGTPEGSPPSYAPIIFEPKSILKVDSSLENKKHEDEEDEDTKSGGTTKTISFA